MRQLTVRGLPEDLEKELRRISSREGVSLNKSVLALLKKATGIDQGRSAKKRDLSSVSGAWDEHQAAEFDDHTRCFEGLDEELWR